MEERLTYFYEDDWNQYWAECKRKRSFALRQTIVFSAIVYGGSLILGSLSVLIRYSAGLPVSFKAWLIIVYCSMLGGWAFLYFEKVKTKFVAWLDWWDSIRIIPRPLNDFSVTRQNKENISGFIYVMRSPSCDLYKLGRSKNPRKRLSRIRRQMPPFDWQLTHLIRVEDYVTAEENLLKQFNHKKAGRKEFFDLDTKDLLAIKSLSAHNLGNAGEIKHIEITTDR